MKYLNFILSISLVILCCIIGWFFYSTYQRFELIDQSMLGLQQQYLSTVGVERKSESDECISAMSSQLWMKLQKKLQNTVVQIFVCNAEYNILQPYKLPKPGQGCGSGFMISADGEIVTNAHVVCGATSIMIQMPAFGKHQFEVDLVGIMPEKDLALLKFKPEDKILIENNLGKMPYLKLGDSDQVLRSQEILALGYPLGQQSLKSTTGVISGRESGMIQMSAPINPGNSGGPSLNCLGEVIGINTAIIAGAQNVGYIIAINDLKIFLKDLRAGGLVRKPYIGIYQTTATVELVKALGNPLPGGTYVVDVLTDSPLHDQLKSGDMIYEINGIPVDLYGEMTVPWSEDKVSTAEYIARLTVGQKVSLVAYRNGEKKKFECTFERKKLAPIRQIYPEYEPMPFEAFGGYVIMPLTLNHVQVLLPCASSLAKYAEDKMQGQPVLVITHIMPDSPAHRARLRLQGSILSKINDLEVKTLDDVCKALAKSGDIITIKTTDDIVVALSKDKIMQAEPMLARASGYEITPCMQQLLKPAKKTSPLMPAVSVGSEKIA